VNQRLGAISTQSLTFVWILSLEPNVSRIRWRITRHDPSSGSGLFGRDVQTDACLFSCSASKHTPFFQTIKVIAAILRANVRRAIVGFIPFLSNAI